MEKAFFNLLEEEGKELNEDKARVSFGRHSVTIEEVDEDGYNLYGDTYYNVYTAFERLKQIGALKN